MLLFVYDYIDVTQFDSYIFIFSIRCFLKTFLTLQFNRRNTVYFKTMVHCVCCLWDSLKRVLGSQFFSTWSCDGCVSASLEFQ